MKPAAKLSPKRPFPADVALRRLRLASRLWGTPAVTEVAALHRDPFRTLVSCILSLRTQDATTALAARRLFAKASTPSALAALPESRIERLIYPAGFYRTKARALRRIARILLDEHDGRVPATLEGLLALPGVGRKTANLVVTVAFGRPGICVDTHVHRITNRWGLVRTRNPHETEMRLREALPRRWWIPVNDLLVAFGQTICRPISPRCSRCPIADLCPRIGVKSHR